MPNDTRNNNTTDGTGDTLACEGAEWSSDWSSAGVSVNIPANRHDTLLPALVNGCGEPESPVFGEHMWESVGSPVSDVNYRLCSNRDALCIARPSLQQQVWLWYGGGYSTTTQVSRLLIESRHFRQCVARSTERASASRVSEEPARNLFPAGDIPATRGEVWLNVQVPGHTGTQYRICEGMRVFCEWQRRNEDNIWLSYAEEYSDADQLRRHLQNSIDLRDIVSRSTNAVRRMRTPGQRARDLLASDETPTQTRGRHDLRIRQERYGRPSRGIRPWRCDERQWFPSFNPNYELMGWQSAFAERAIHKDKLVLFGDAGVGKTRAALLARLNWRNKVARERIVGDGAWNGTYPRIKTLWITANSARIEVFNEAYGINLAGGIKTLTGSSSQRIRQLESGSGKYTFVTNYESLRTKLFDSLITKQWDCIIIDEAHKIKDPSTKTAQRVIQLGQDVRFKMVMTGTPLLNSEIDLWAPLFFCDSEAWDEEVIENSRRVECLTQT